jgi:hypothetical protein
VPNSLNRHVLAGITSWGYGCAEVSIFMFCTIKTFVHCRYKRQEVRKTASKHSQKQAYRHRSSLSFKEQAKAIHTANEGLVRIQYKCLVPIYVCPEWKLLFPKQNYNVLSPCSYTHISVRDLYVSRIGLLILLQEIICINPGNI